MDLLATPPPEVETLLPLTSDETRRLKECERTIQRGLDTFYEVGNALAEIRESRLYRISYATFEDYCRVKWDMSRFYAHRLIDAAQVVENLLPMGNVPTNERQARELTKFEPDVQKAVWHIVVGSADTDNEGNPRVTEAHIRSVKNILTEVVKAGGMDDGSGEIKPLGQLITAAVTEETYERMMRQKEYIKQAKEKEAEEAKSKPKRVPKEKPITPSVGDDPILSNDAREFLDDYMVELSQWPTKIPSSVSEVERETLEKMIHEQGADALWLRNRTLQSDCDAILTVMKDTEGASHTGEMAAADLYKWLSSLRYFIAESEYNQRLQYMNREDIRMALLTDAGPDGKQEDRRGKLPGIVCLPWRKVWNQKAKAERDEDDDDAT